MLWWMLAACDDTEFPPVGGGAAVVGDSYEDVLQVFESDCYQCHNPSLTSGGLDLETDACAAIVGVTSPVYDAPRVAPGDSAGSVLWNKMADTGLYGGPMPVGAPSAPESIDTVAAWIDGGALCDGGTTP